MFSAPFARRRRHRLPRRRLGAERLEDRRLLNGGGWYGNLVSDQSADLFAVDLIDDVRLEWLGQMDTMMFDLAFSPSGELYGIGGPLEGPSGLFRIQVDLEDPDPAQLIRTTRIGTVRVPGDGPLFLNSLEFREDGTLLGAGYDSQFRNFVYSIDPGSAEAAEQVSLNGYASGGDLAFDADGNLYVTTFESVLLQIDPGLSLVNVVGPLAANDFFGTTYGPAPIMVGFRYTHDVYRINTRNAATTYLDTLSHPMLFGILGAATVFEPPADLGRVDFLELADQQPILGELWYRVEAAHDGFLTVDLPGVSPGNGTQVVFYRQDLSGNLDQIALGEVRADYATAVTGAKYFVRIVGAEAGVDVRLTNLVSPDGLGAVIHGTEGNDPLEFRAGPPHSVVIHDVEYEFDPGPGQVADFTFDGGEGDDQVSVEGSSRSDQGTLRFGSAEFSGYRYELSVDNAESIIFAGGGGDDEATLIGSDGPDASDLLPRFASLSPALAAVENGTDYYDLRATDVADIEVRGGTGLDLLHYQGKAGKDTVELWPLRGEFRGSAYSILAVDFENLGVNSDDAEDELALHGSDGPDRLAAAPSLTTLVGAGFWLAGGSFSTVVAYAGDGDDAADFSGSAGRDEFAAGPGVAAVSGQGFSVTGWEFEEVLGHGGDEFDTARLYDSRGNDYFAAAPGMALIEGPGLDVWIDGFEAVHAYSHLGKDEARLYDSKGDDTFRALPGEAALYGDNFYHRAKNFAGVHTYSHAGFDVAEFFDTAGNDQFVASPTEGAMYGPGYYNRAKFFDQLNGHASQGFDRATLTDSSGNDSFYATGTIAGMMGDGFHNTAGGFDTVTGRSQAGGVDVAKLFDSLGPDTFTAWPDIAVLEGTGFENVVEGFAGVHAYAVAGGVDTAVLHDSDGADTFLADPIEAVLYGAGFYNRAKHFENAQAHADAAGRDVAYLYGSDGNDEFFMMPQFGRLSGLGFSNQATLFEEVYALARGGDDDRATLNDSPQPDRLDAWGDRARLSNAVLDFIYEVGEFDDVTANATGPDDVAYVVEPLSFTLNLNEHWSDPP